MVVTELETEGGNRERQRQKGVTERERQRQKGVTERDRDRDRRG